MIISDEPMISSAAIPTARTRRTTMIRRALMIMLAAVCVGVLPITLGGQVGTFSADWTFKGSALSGTQQIGQAAWRAENGEIVGTPASLDGGWLLLDRG